MIYKKVSSVQLQDLLDCARDNPGAAIRTAYREIEGLRETLQFVRDLAGEAIDNGDVRVGQAAEIAMRHIFRRAEELLGH